MKFYSNSFNGLKKYIYFLSLMMFSEISFKFTFIKTYSVCDLFLGNFRNNPYRYKINTLSILKQILSLNFRMVIPSKNIAAKIKREKSLADVSSLT